MELRIDNAKYWKECIDTIVNLVDEGVFNVTKEGVTLKAMDPSSISMISFFMPSKAFSKYDVEKSVGLGLNIDNLSKIMSRARDGEALIMKEHDNKLTLEFSGQSKRRFKTQLIDVRKSVEKEPNVQFDANIEINGETFKELVKDATIVSEYISLKATKDQFVIDCRGDSGELNEEHLSDGSAIKKISSEKSAEATFNLQFLENMVKSCPPGSYIDISLKSNEPLKLSYKVGDAQITYFLAPYMES
ncbi:MAG: proliferating cell nuclear antigen (pcna) [Candidatus Marsarchaeota archaeon]|nr:proliferating cell nuclear antigen (pcna) [Candidatus Marsarchaeota archaeon]